MNHKAVILVNTKLLQMLLLSMFAKEHSRLEVHCTVAHRGHAANNKVAANKIKLLQIK